MNFHRDISEGDTRLPCHMSVLETHYRLVSGINRPLFLQLAYIFLMTLRVSSFRTGDCLEFVSGECFVLVIVCFAADGIASFLFVTCLSCFHDLSMCAEDSCCHIAGKGYSIDVKIVHKCNVLFQKFVRQMLRASFSESPGAS